MYKTNIYVLISFFVFTFCLVCGCEKDWQRTTGKTDERSNLHKSNEPVYLVIDNHSISKHQIFEKIKANKTELVTELQPFELKQIEIKKGKHIFFAQDAENLKNAEITINIKADFTYLWDLKGGNEYIEYRMNSEETIHQKTLKDTETGYYEFNKNIWFLRPVFNIQGSINKICKHVKEDEAISRPYAEKIAFEMPYAFTPAAQKASIDYLASELTGIELEQNFFMLFNSNYRIISEMAGYYLSLKGSKEFGNKILGMLLTGWGADKPGEKVTTAIQMVIGLTGVEGLYSLWDRSDANGKAFIVVAVERSDFDASVLFMLDQLASDNQSLAFRAFRYLNNVHRIHIKNVYQALKEISAVHDKKDPKQGARYSVLSNALIALEKFVYEHQLEVLVDNLRFQNFNLMRVGLQKLINEFGIDGLKLLIEEYISLPEAIRIEAVNHVMFLYLKDPKKQEPKKVKQISKELIDFMKLVIAEDNLDVRWQAISVCAQKQVMNFDKSIIPFLRKFQEKETTEKNRKHFKSIVDKGYVEYLAQLEFTAENKQNLHLLVKSGEIESAILAYNTLKKQLSAKDFNQYILELKTDFAKYPPDNRGLLLAMLSKEFSLAESKIFLLTGLTDKSAEVRNIAFDRLLSDSRLVSLADVNEALKTAADTEPNPEFKKKFVRMLKIKQLNEIIYEEMSPEILKIIEGFLLDADDLLVKTVVETLQGLEYPGIINLLKKNFSSMQEAQRTQIADYLANYHEIDFDWYSEIISDESKKVRKAAFFGLYRLVKQGNEIAKEVCEKFLTAEKNEELKAEFQKILAD